MARVRVGSETAGLVWQQRARTSQKVTRRGKNPLAHLERKKLQSGWEVFYSLPLIPTILDVGQTKAEKMMNGAREENRTTNSPF